MSKIEWTDETWNPVTGCTPAGTGCKHCYAKEMHRRLRAMGQPKYQHDWSEVRCHRGELDRPLHWRKPRMVFVNSMSDTFHPDVPLQFLDDLWLTMSDASWHTFMILTKRPRAMFKYLTKHHRNYKPLPNLWLGTSVSRQPDLDPALFWLLESPGAIHFLSAEPLLGPLDLTDVTTPKTADIVGLNALTGEVRGPGDIYPKLDWLIIGSESGSHRRECDNQWIASIVRQCIQANTPVFVKQAHEGNRVVKMPKILGRVWDQMPTCQ